MCTLYLTHGRTDWCISATPKPHTEITSGSRSRNGGKKLGEDFSSLRGNILYCVDFHNEIYSYIAYVQKQKVKTDSILVGTRDVTPRNTSAASHKQLIDGIAPHITCSASEPKLRPPGENILQVFCYKLTSSLSISTPSAGASCSLLFIVQSVSLILGCFVGIHNNYNI